jgi:tripartite-type tricarboxylate transporter receptor subunit TctC
MLGGALPHPSYAASYPARPVRLVVPFPPGGSNDLVARILAQKLDEIWNQRVIVDNRAGANGVIGTELVAHAAPDGYTLLLVPAAHAINATLLKGRLPYDPIRDFAPVTNIASAPNVLVVHPTVPARTVKELVRLAKSRPGELTYGSAGVGFPSHLAAEMLKSMAHIEMLHVPYKGAGPAMADLVSGHIDLVFPSLPGALPHIRSGRLRALAVTSAKRSSIVPELPTIAETLPGFEAATWFGIFLPAGAPSDVVAKLNAAIVQVVRQPEVVRALQKQGAEPIGNTPAEFARYVQAEIAKWARVIEDAHVKPE